MRDCERSVAVPEVLQQLEPVIRDLGTSAFGPTLLDFLRRQVGFDCALVVYYHRRRRPVVLEDQLNNAMRTNEIAHYLAGAYLLDPFYLQSRQINQPCILRLRDIAPADFEQSEYFASYYRGSQVVDELNVMIPFAPGQVFVACLERAHPSPSFGSGDFAILDAVLGAVAALAQRHMALSDLTYNADNSDSEHERLETVLRHFGSAILTRREHEVVQLILNGHSAPDVARLLGVSLDTAKVHRRNIYSKLGISSLAELFALALQAMGAARGANGDPLSNLLGRSPA